MNYQVMPGLTPEEYQMLKVDIAENGVLVPVEYDEEGNVLDGHHRIKICEELGIGEWPSIVRTGFTEEQKRAHARRLNLNRRHLTQEQKRELIRQQLVETPQLSDRQIAKDLGVDNSTVSAHRKRLVEEGQVLESNTSIGADGKEYPRYREAPSVQPSPTTDQVDYTTQASEEACSPPEPEVLVRKDAALRMSESNEWYTPDKYIEAARKVLGEIDLDPASCGLANETVQAKVYFDKEKDGLAQEWFGRVWMNPPYGGLSGPFVAKLLSEFEAGNVEEAIVLVNSNSTDTNWFRPLWNHILCFTDHRINFYSPQEKPSGSTHGSVFIYIGPNWEGFADTFKEFGAVVARWGT